MNGLLDQINLHEAPNGTPEDTTGDGPQTTVPQSDAPGAAVDFNPYEAEPAWRDFPCEWKRPRFAHIGHEIDWVKLYELRRSAQGATKSGNDIAAATPVTGGK